MDIESVRSRFTNRGIVPSSVKQVAEEVRVKVQSAQRTAALELALELNEGGAKVIID